MNQNVHRVLELSDGLKSSTEIARIVGVSPRYVRRIMLHHNLPRLHCGARMGEKNNQFVSGRRIDLDGYVLVTAPKDHPTARNRTNRNTKLIFEHRMAIERYLGRYLLSTEVVDHLNGLTLHNDPANLRVFDKNSEHLRETISGIPKKISSSGLNRIRTKHLQLPSPERIDTYGLRRKRGDVRLRQILLAALQLGIDSPFLSGTTYWLEKAGIFHPSRSNLKQALDDLTQRWKGDLLR